MCARTARAAPASIARWSARQLSPPPTWRLRTVGRLVIDVDHLDEYEHMVALLASFRGVRARVLARMAAPPPAAETLERDVEAPAEREPRRDGVRHKIMSSINTELS